MCGLDAICSLRFAPTSQKHPTHTKHYTLNTTHTTHSHTPHPHLVLYFLDPLARVQVAPVVRVDDALHLLVAARQEGAEVLARVVDGRLAQAPEEGGVMGCVMGVSCLCDDALIDPGS